MIDVERLIRERGEHVAPTPDGATASWDDVLVRAGMAPSHRASRRPRRLAASALVVAVAAAALVLVWPFGTEHGTVLDRALAAAGDGPVLHVVLRGEWGGTLVDLSSGERAPIYGEKEVWFDTDTGQTHSIDRLGGIVQGEEIGKPYKPAAELAALGREYKRALESGKARISGEATLDGEPVVWITIDSELFPDVADGQDHEWAQQVAVSKRTFKPVALRQTRDGQPGPGTLQRVLELELISRSDGDFTTSRPSRRGTAVREGRDPIALEEAAAVLGRTPLWLGRNYDGLPLAQVYRETTSVGHQQRVRVTGAKAAAAIRCSQLRAAAGGDCFRALGMGSIEVRPDGVFTTYGPLQWRDEQSAVVFFYGTVGDDPKTYPEDAVPQFDKPYVTVTESTRVSPARRGAGSYVPPEGSVFIAAGGGGFMQRDGLQVGIAAVDEAAVVAAARALAPMMP